LSDKLLSTAEVRRTRRLDLRMKPILFVRNDSFETFGVAPSAFEEAGAEVRVFEAIDGAPRPRVDEVSGVVVFGSSSNIEHADHRPFIKEVAELTRESVDAGVPVLGVCFGAQLLAWALDAEVGKAPEREVGFQPMRLLPAAGDDRLVSHYADGDHLFEWHMDTFALPDGAELLMTGDRVTNQAYRLGETAWGLQFHFEVDAAELEHWLDAYAEIGDLQEEWGKSPDEVRAEARLYLAEHERKGKEVFGRFVEVARERSG
jgi:GMP synthase (glutamine-hydrolysing)